MIYEDIPKLFTDSDIYDIKDYILKNELEMKNLGNYFTSPKNIYGNNISLSKDNLNLIGKNFGRILLHEWFYFFFPQYFQYYSATVDILLMQDEFIPINWRFYIAIMVI